MKRGVGLHLSFIERPNPKEKVTYMDLKKKFATDPVKELEGVWIPLDAETKLKIARVGNPKYRELMTKVMAPFRSALRNNVLPEETAEKLLIQVTARTILLDWEGVEHEGAPLPYSLANAEMLLAVSKEFKSFVDEIANQVDIFKTAEEDAAIKN